MALSSSPAVAPVRGHATRAASSGGRKPPSAQSGSFGCRVFVGALILTLGYLLGMLSTTSTTQSGTTTTHPGDASSSSSSSNAQPLFGRRASSSSKAERDLFPHLSNRTALRLPLDADETFSRPEMRLIPGDFEAYAPDCSGPTPARGYPQKVAIAQIVQNWNPDEASRVPEKMFRTICRFDYQTELEIAMAYRDAEVPFQLYNVPEMNELARKWADDDYMRRRLGSRTKFKCEASNPGGEANHGANHFMYTNGRAAPSRKPPPIKHVRLTWDEWLKKEKSARNASVDEPDTRFYFRFSASSPSDPSANWLFEELPFFQPREGIFLREPRGQRGIHCRFGMSGVIAEAHWDGSRNMIAQFYGRRRYILVDPDDSCDMYLLSKNHPSGRHSEVDWSKPETWEKYPNFPNMRAHEVIQRPGDFLYLPTYYLHYIISLDKNYQCNTRSGRDDRQTHVVNRCTPGFEHLNNKNLDKKKYKKSKGELISSPSKRAARGGSYAVQ